MDVKKESERFDVSEDIIKLFAECVGSPEQWRDENLIDLLQSGLRYLIKTYAMSKDAVRDARFTREQFELLEPFVKQVSLDPLDEHGDFTRCMEDWPEGYAIDALFFAIKGVAYGINNMETLCRLLYNGRTAMPGYLERYEIVTTGNDPFLAALNAGWLMDEYLSGNTYSRDEILEIAGKHPTLIAENREWTAALSIGKIA